MSPESTLSLRSIRTSSIETRIRHRFLRSLMRIKSRNAVLTLGDVSQRSRRIKMAAFSSMALAAGSKQAWSRALIFKIRNRGRWYSKKRYAQRQRNRSTKCIKKRRPSSSTAAETSRVDKLRKLVPGGDAMDLCKLLEETAVYVKYLSAQVKVMQKVADDLSAREEKIIFPLEESLKETR